MIDFLWRGQGKGFCTLAACCTRLLCSQLSTVQIVAVLIATTLSFDCFCGVWIVTTSSKALTYNKDFCIHLASSCDPKSAAKFKPGVINIKSLC